MPIQFDADRDGAGTPKGWTWPQSPGAGFVGRGGWRFVAAIGLGLLTFGGMEGVLAGSAYFKAHAIAGMSEADRASGAIAEAAILARAKPVLTRAAIALRDKGFSTVAPEAVGASGAENNLERDLESRISLVPEPAMNALVIEARAETGETAAAIANAVAGAFIDVQNDAAVAQHAAREAFVASRLRTLSDLADAAHRRLDSVLAAGDDPAQPRLHAAAVAARAKTHFEAFQTMLASGSPPLGAQTGLPPSIAPLQAAYLELKHQMDVAKGSLGDRYIAANGLDTRLALSAKLLQAEWQRLTEVARANWERARDAEASLAKTESASGAESPSAIADARLAARAADDALAQFQTGAATGDPSDRPYRLIKAAAIPESAAGLTKELRHLFAGFAGLAMAVLTLRSRRPAPREARSGVEPDAEADDLAGSPGLDEDFDTAREPWAGGSRRVAFADRASPRDAGEGDWVDREQRRGLPRLAISDVLDDLARFDPRPGCPLTVFIGTLGDSASTAPVALALARAAAWAGHRVLLIEGSRRQSLLAGAVAIDAEPVVVDVLGMLKAAIPDRLADGLYLAPALPGAARLASDLARAGEVAFIGHAQDEFDLAIFDGGHVDAQAQEDWGQAADATIRAGGLVSHSEDERFLTAIGGRSSGFLGPVRGQARPPRRLGFTETSLDADEMVPEYDDYASAA